MSSLAVSMAPATDLLNFAETWAQESPWKPERARSYRCCAGSISCNRKTTPLQLLDAFTKAAGVKIEITRESYEDVQPKASVAANTGAGPDLFWSLHSLPHLFADKCVDVTDIAEYLGQKYGGWVESAQQCGKCGSRIQGCAGRRAQPFCSTFSPQGQSCGRERPAGSFVSLVPQARSSCSCWRPLAWLRSAPSTRVRYR
jgi:extracellular solute-binding protein